MSRSDPQPGVIPPYQKEILYLPIFYTYEINWIYTVFFPDGNIARAAVY